MSASSLLLTTGRAVQQPVWENDVHLERVRAELSELPALIGADEIRTLRALLSTVAQGRATIIQAGDCAEDPQESTNAHVARKVALLNVLAGTMRMKTHRPVLRVGRIGGQYAKPRSKPTEIIDGVELPSFRGHLVNGPQPHPVHRRANPDRMLAGYWAANRVMGHLGWRVPSSLSVIEPPVWTSHEALLLDYEEPQLRRDGENRMVLTSTHWPWIGDRTRHLDGPHVELFSRIANPVACKVGPSMTTEELLALCDKLDPEHESGRLTLIARLGASAVRTKLPDLVAAVRESGHPVIWLCDPLHANTVSTDSGYKTRHVQTAIDEVRGFREVLDEAGVHSGGLHLEATPDDVVECVFDDSQNHEVGQRYSTLCDPRLNTAQAAEVVSAW